MAEVCVAVDGGAAHVHSDVFGMDGHELFLAARERVVEVDFALLHIFDCIVSSCIPMMGWGLWFSPRMQSYGFLVQWQNGGGQKGLANKS